MNIIFKTRLLNLKCKVARSVLFSWLESRSLSVVFNSKPGTEPKPNRTLRGRFLHPFLGEVSGMVKNQTEPKPKRTRLGLFLRRLLGEAHLIAKIRRRTETEPNIALLVSPSAARRSQPNGQHFEGPGVNMLVSCNNWIVWCHGAAWQGFRTDSKSDSIGVSVYCGKCRSVSIALSSFPCRYVGVYGLGDNGK